MHKQGGMGAEVQGESPLLYFVARETGGGEGEGLPGTRDGNGVPPAPLWSLAAAQDSSPPSR